MISLAFYRIDWKSPQSRPVQPPCPSAAWTDNFRHSLEMARSSARGYWPKWHEKKWSQFTILILG